MPEFLLMVTFFIKLSWILCNITTCIGSERSSTTTVASTRDSVNLKLDTGTTFLREPPGGASSAGEPEQMSSVASPSGLLELQNSPQTSLHETKKLVYILLTVYVR